MEGLGGLKGSKVNECQAPRSQTRLLGLLSLNQGLESSAQAPSSGPQTLLPSLPLPLGTSGFKFQSIGTPSPLRLLFKKKKTFSLSMGPEP